MCSGETDFVDSIKEGLAQVFQAASDLSLRQAIRELEENICDLGPNQKPEVLREALQMSCVGVLLELPVLHRLESALTNKHRSFLTTVVNFASKSDPKFLLQGTMAATVSALSKAKNVDDFARCLVVALRLCPLVCPDKVEQVLRPLPVFEATQPGSTRILVSIILAFLQNHVSAQSTVYKLLMDDFTSPAALIAVVKVGLADTSLLVKALQSYPSWVLPQFRCFATAADFNRPELEAAVKREMLKAPTKTSMKLCDLLPAVPLSDPSSLLFPEVVQMAGSHFTEACVLVRCALKTDTTKFICTAFEVMSQLKTPAEKCTLMRAMALAATGAGTMSDDVVELISGFPALHEDLQKELVVLKVRLGLPVSTPHALHHYLSLAFLPDDTLYKTHLPVKELEEALAGMNSSTASRRQVALAALIVLLRSGNSKARASVQNNWPSSGSMEQFLSLAAIGVCMRLGVDHIVDLNLILQGRCRRTLWTDKPSAVGSVEHKRILCQTPLTSIATPMLQMYVDALFDRLFFQSDPAGLWPFIRALWSISRTSSFVELPSASKAKMLLILRHPAHPRVALGTIECRVGVVHQQTVSSIAKTAESAQKRVLGLAAADVLASLDRTPSELADCLSSLLAPNDPFELTDDDECMFFTPYDTLYERDEDALTAFLRESQHKADVADSVEVKPISKPVTQPAKAASKAASKATSKAKTKSKASSAAKALLAARTGVTSTSTKQVEKRKEEKKPEVVVAVEAAPLTKLDKQNLRKLEVGRYSETFLCRLRLATALARGGSRFPIPSLLAFAKPLLRSPVTRMAAETIMGEAVNRLVARERVTRRSFLPACLAAVAADEVFDKGMVTALLQSVGRAELLPEEVELLLPVLFHAMTKTVSVGPEATRAALDLLTLQIDLAAEIRPVTVLKSLTNVMALHEDLIACIAKPVYALVTNMKLDQEAVLALTEMGHHESEDGRAMVLQNVLQLEEHQLLPVAAIAPFMYDSTKAISQMARLLIARSPQWDRATVATYATASLHSHVEWLRETAAKSFAEHVDVDSPAIVSLVESFYGIQDDWETAVIALEGYQATKEEIMFMQGGNKMDKALALATNGPHRAKIAVLRALVETQRLGKVTAPSLIQQVLRLLLITLSRPELRLKAYWPFASALLECVKEFVTLTVPLDLENNPNLIFDVVQDFSETHRNLPPTAPLKTTSVSGKAGVVAGLEPAQVRMACAVVQAPVTKLVTTTHMLLCRRVLDASLAVFLDDTDFFIQDCLTPLMPAVCASGIVAMPVPGQQVIHRVGRDLVDSQLDRLVVETDSATRRGLSLTIASEIKGLGVVHIRSLGVLDRILLHANEKKRDVTARLGVLSLIEGCARVLDRLLEPFVSLLIPILLTSMADGHTEVRELADRSSNAVMSLLSGYGVRRVMPELVSVVRDDGAKAKTVVGACEILGSMAHCTPKQLALCLSQVVPTLNYAVTHANMQVQQAGARSLERIAGVIRDVEISAISPLIVKSFVDPTPANIEACLDGILSASFTRRIEPASLALLIPVVSRGIIANKADVKRKATFLCANLIKLARSPQDFLPFYPELLPLLNVTLVDPTPVVRSETARAFGRIASLLGTDLAEELLVTSFDRLKNATTSVERSGVANALAEVYAALGVTRLRKDMDRIMLYCAHRMADVREGFVGLFVYLPVTLKTDFSDLVPNILPTLLHALSDPVEPVRDGAFRASNVMVKDFGATHSALFLTPLENGCHDDDWRIRQSAVLLLGTMLDRVLRPASEIGAIGGEQMLMETLALERRAFILSSLLMVKSDESIQVRQAANNVWKGVVTNSPKTIRELLPILVPRLLNFLGSGSEQKIMGASRCLGDLVQKFGSQILPRILPVFTSTLQDRRAETAKSRLGVMLGISQIISANLDASHEMVLELLPCVQLGLTDTDEIREESILVMARMVDAVGETCLQETIPELISNLLNPPCWDPEDFDDSKMKQLEGIEALLGLQTALVLPFVMSLSLKRPIHVSKIRLLGTLTGIKTLKVIAQQVEVVVPKLLDVACNAEDEHRDVAFTEVASCLGKILAKVAHPTTRHSVLPGIIDHVRPVGLTGSYTDTLAGPQEEPSAHVTTERRVLLAALTLVVPNVDTEKTDFVRLIFPLTVRVMLTDTDEAVVKGAMALFQAVVLQCSAECLDMLPDFRTLLFNAVKDPISAQEVDHVLPGLRHKEVLEAVIAYTSTALQTTDSNYREHAAIVYGLLFSHAELSALKPVCLKAAGSLIRLCAERLPSTVKCALLHAITRLVKAAGVQLRPMAPQLQTTFLRAVVDASSQQVRNAAGMGLLVFPTLPGARLDNVVAELTSRAEMETDNAVRSSLQTALLNLLEGIPATAKLAPATVQKLWTYARSAEHSEGGWIASVTFARYLPDEDVDDALRYVLTRRKSPLVPILSAPACWRRIELQLPEILAFIRQAWMDKSSRLLGMESFSAVCSAHKTVDEDELFALTDELCQVVKAVGVSDTSFTLSSIKAVKTLARYHHPTAHNSANVPILASLVDIVVDCLQFSNPAVKLQSERCLVHLVRLPYELELDIFEQVAPFLDARKLKFLSDYTKRVLSRVGRAESDHDDE